ncbi:MAG: hypothetical protein E7E91_12215 [Staphylococcus aureus]|nr:hypothetical protein [Staphylococcus aureus]ETD11203.1 hypothetical protein HMPREF1276_01618 [Staphylococcus aureus subsp. aureus KPL1845]MBU7116078.1 hypothetical protein [Staphylococcus aureus]MDI1506632.1 hypothetical protein [Staphylococcus aureus]MDU2120550.1 hypothetical protein [Staphylococcus aureus]MDU3280171.1 hypothetical protein [Staphylococcus aureus]
MAYLSEYVSEPEVLQQLEDLGCERANIHNVELETNTCLNKELGVLKHD